MVASLSGCDLSERSRTSDANWVVDSHPIAGERNLLRVDHFYVELDRLPLPTSVDRHTVRLASGDLSELTWLRIDPVRRRVWMHAGEYLPLEPETDYRIELAGLQDLDRQHMGEDVHIRFRTGVEQGVLRPPPAASWQQVAPLLAERCGSAGCHAGENPVVGLDLSGPAGVRDTAIGQLSSQSPAGSTAPWGARGANTLSGLRIIDVAGGAGRPASSYLMYKVLGEEHIVGDPMPPGDPGLSTAELELLSDWITSGASTQ